MDTSSSPSSSQSRAMRAIPLSLLLSCGMLGFLFLLRLSPYYFVHIIPYQASGIIASIVLPVLAIFSIIRGHIIRRTLQSTATAVTLGLNDAGLALSYVALILTWLLPYGGLLRF